MSTVLIIVLIVVVVIAVAAAIVFLGPGRGRVGGGTSLKSRFGPEYDRVVARHEGDTKAAELELGERVKRYGDFRPRELTRERHESYVALWAGIQEQFVDSPPKAVAEAHGLVSRVAAERGYPEGGKEQMDALSVHHAKHLDGFRRVGRASRGEGGTEEMREALVEARELFEALVTDRVGRTAAHDGHGRGAQHGKDGKHGKDEHGSHRPGLPGRSAKPKGSGV